MIRCFDIFFSHRDFDFITHCGCSNFEAYWGGEVFYKRGPDNTFFFCLKFATMLKNSHQWGVGQSPFLVSDSLGILRDTKINELSIKIF